MARIRSLFLLVPVLVTLGAVGAVGWGPGARSGGPDGAAVALAGLSRPCGADTCLTCPGGERPFAPAGVAFGASGTLYVTDAVNGSVFRLEGDRCVTIAEGWSRPYGVAALDDGRVCVSHFTSDDPLTRQAAVSCLDGAGWGLAARGLGSRVDGLAATPEGIWLAAWEDTPVESRDGVLRLLAGNRVAREDRLEDGLPRFLAAGPDGGLAITVVREDASGITGGAVIVRSPDGRFERLVEALDAPAGVAWSDQGIWIADDGSGELLLLMTHGRRLVHPRNLQGAAGLAVSAEGDICVAEPGLSRIVCTRPERMLGKETQHEE